MGLPLVGLHRLACRGRESRLQSSLSTVVLSLEPTSVPNTYLGTCPSSLNLGGKVRMCDHVPTSSPRKAVGAMAASCCRTCRREGNTQAPAQLTDVNFPVPIRCQTAHPWTTLSLPSCIAFHSAPPQSNLLVSREAIGTAHFT